MTQLPFARNSCVSIRTEFWRLDLLDLTQLANLTRFSEFLLTAGVTMTTPMISAYIPNVATMRNATVAVKWYSQIFLGSLDVVMAPGCMQDKCLLMDLGSIYVAIFPGIPSMWASSAYSTEMLKIRIHLISVFVPPALVHLQPFWIPAFSRPSPEFPGLVPIYCIRALFLTHGCECTHNSNSQTVKIRARIKMCWTRPWPNSANHD